MCKNYFRQIIKTKILYWNKLDFNIIKYDQLEYTEEKIKEIENEIRKVLKYIEGAQNSLKEELVKNNFDN